MVSSWIVPMFEFAYHGYKPSSKLLFIILLALGVGGDGVGGGDGGLVAVVDGQPETQFGDPQCASLYPQKPHCEQQAPFAQVVCAEHNRR